MKLINSYHLSETEFQDEVEVSKKVSIPIGMKIESMLKF